MIAALENLNIIKSSLINHGNSIFALANVAGQRRLVVLDKNLDDRWQGERIEKGQTNLLLGPLSSKNAQILQENLVWLKPHLLGLHTSAGLGDRLGLATPGHVRAMQHFENQISPIFPQQSIREMSRSIRTPQDVMNDAIWGIFQENWQGGFGADADHLKTEEDIESCFLAGYTFFTIDPGEYVENRAETCDFITLTKLLHLLPTEMQIDKTGLLYQDLDFDTFSLHFSEEILTRAMVKYGRAVNHVARLYHYLQNISHNRPFELEVSVDETDLPTSWHEHAYIASELKRLGVKWVSLAPRYVGRFEKGVDYIGDLETFKRDIDGHAEIARFFGPYKLSLHSGSDKYSIYTISMEATRGLVHLKTAGTSYLTGLKTISRLDVNFLKNIYSFAREHYDEDRKTYHVSADLSNIPQDDQVSDWQALIDQFDSRQVFHVTFGSVMSAKNKNGNYIFRTHLMELLNENNSAYAQDLESHFIRHLTPFCTNNRRNNK